MPSVLADAARGVASRDEKMALPDVTRRRQGARGEERPVRDEDEKPRDIDA
jgi:hypothetical protein